MMKLLLPLVLLFASLTCFGFAPEFTPEQVKEYHQEAELGNAGAQWSLGLLYRNGWGVTKDYTEAAKWYRKAADQGDAEAQYNLGAMYDNGEGVPEDDTEAAKWYRKVAEQGHCRAQYNLGSKYDTGEGVPEDFVFAYMWLNLAAAEGNEKAKNWKNVLSKDMTKEQIAEAQKLSREWMAKRQD